MNTETENRKLRADLQNARERIVEFANELAMEREMNGKVSTFRFWAAMYLAVIVGTVFGVWIAS